MAAALHARSPTQLLHVAEGAAVFLRQNGLSTVDPKVSSAAGKSFLGDLTFSVEDHLKLASRRLDVIELRLLCRVIGIPLSQFIEELESALTGESFDGPG